VCHIEDCPDPEIFLSSSCPNVMAPTDRDRSAREGAAVQKNGRRRAMPDIGRKITALLAAAGLWAHAPACGPSVVNLGARGGGLADGAGAGAAAAVSGASGASAGDGAAPIGQAGTGGARSGAAAASGAGSRPSIEDDAGVMAPPDASRPATGPEPSRGCGTQPPASDTSVTRNGSTASYIVDLASGYDRNRPYPLVISFRGANVTAAAFRSYFDLPAVVGADGIVVNMDCADGAVSWDLQRDLPLFDALLDKLESSYCIDQRRVFAVGHATGAIFANSLACMRTPVLRGLGSLSGASPIGMCAGQLAVWISQGNAEMSRTLGRADRDFWVQQNQCNANATAPVDPSPCREYADCAMGYPVRYCEYDGNLDLPSFAASGVWSFLRGL
jgi:hypothetical protein